MSIVNSSRVNFAFLRPRQFGLRGGYCVAAQAQGHKLPAAPAIGSIVRHRHHNRSASEVARWSQLRDTRRTVVWASSSEIVPSRETRLSVVTSMIGSHSAAKRDSITSYPPSTSLTHRPIPTARAASVELSIAPTNEATRPDPRSRGRRRSSPRYGPTSKRSANDPTKCSPTWPTSHTQWVEQRGHGAVSTTIPHTHERTQSFVLISRRANVARRSNPDTRSPTSRDSCKRL